MTNLAGLTPITLGTEPKFPGPEEIQPSYDRKRDVLYLTIKNPPPAVSVDLFGEAWLRIVPETGQIVGLEIDDFVRRFLPAHAEMAAAWNTSHRSRVRRLFHHNGMQELVGQIWVLVKQCFAAQPALRISDGPTAS